MIRMIMTVAIASDISIAAIVMRHERFGAKCDIYTISIASSYTSGHGAFYAKKKLCVVVIGVVMMYG